MPFRFCRINVAFLGILDFRVWCFCRECRSTSASTSFIRLFYIVNMITNSVVFCKVVLMLLAISAIGNAVERNDFIVIGVLLLNLYYKVGILYSARRFAM